MRMCPLSVLAIKQNACPHEEACALREKLLDGGWKRAAPWVQLCGVWVKRRKLEATEFRPFDTNGLQKQPLPPAPLPE